MWIVLCCLVACFDRLISFWKGYWVHISLIQNLLIGFIKENRKSDLSLLKRKNTFFPILLLTRLNVWNKDVSIMYNHSLYKHNIHCMKLYNIILIIKYQTLVYHSFVLNFCFKFFPNFSLFYIIPLYIITQVSLSPINSLRHPLVLISELYDQL